MKKVLSLFLALIMVFCANTTIVANAVTKVNAEDKLVSIQKTTGFIPGQNASVLYNCFAFVSDVCEKLYGVSYWYEQMNSNYSVKHTSNFYTVKTYTTGNTTALTTSEASAIKNFFLSNAQPGDIVHYGGLNGGSTHTFMIQHIDSQKMQIYHSNYGIAPYSSAHCHIDTLRWDSFVANPTKSVYNADNSCYSLNAMFNNKLKGYGLGITINRYSKYTTYFNTINTGVTSSSTTTTSTTKPAKITGLTATKVDKEAIDIKWNSEKNSSQYYIYITNNTKGTTFSKTVTTTSTTLAGLTLNNKYTIKVRGVNSVGTSGDYSDSITVTTGTNPTTTTTTTTTTTASTKPAKITGVATTKVDKESIAIKWTADKNSAKYYIYVTNDTKGTNFNKTVTTNTATLSGLTLNNKYTIKVRGVNSSGTNGTYSDPLTVTTKAPAVTKVSGIEFTEKTTTTLSFKWKKVTDATKYYIYIKNESKGTNFNKTVTTLSTKISGLSPGNTYSVKIKAYIKDKGYAEYSSVVKACAKPNKPTINTPTSPSKKNIKVSWKKVGDIASGYQIYIATDSAFTKNLKKITVSGQSKTSYTVSGLTSGKKYYVKVRAYKTVDSVKTYGSFSSVKNLKCK